MVAIILILFLSSKAFYYFAPFIIAFGLASLMEPLVRVITKRTKISRKIVSAFSVIIVIALIAFLIFIIIFRVITEIKGMRHVIPLFINEVYRNIDSLNTGGNNILIQLPEELTQIIGGALTSLFSTLENILNYIFKGILNTAVSLPAALIFILVTILSTYFISSGKEDMRHAFKSKLPEAYYDKYRTIKDEVFLAIFKLLTAYLIIMSITFTEVLIGLSIIGVKYALLLAFIICLVDILPVLGTGTVMIPWTLYEFINGSTRMGVALLILYIIILVIRQMIEPKIIGHQIGVHPLITLMSIYVGLKLLGPFGLLLGPITMVIIKTILSVLYKDKSILDILFKPVSYDLNNK